MHFTINAEQLRAALKEIEEAESNGFMHCLCVFSIASAGPTLKETTANFSDLWERADPIDGSLNWGRFQRVSKRFAFDPVKRELVGRGVVP